MGVGRADVMIVCCVSMHLSFSTHSLCGELSSMLVLTGTMCQIISLHAQPETHWGTYKGISPHSKHRSYVIVWASRGLRGGFVSCQHLRNPTTTFSLFLWKVPLWCPYSNAIQSIQSSRSQVVEMLSFFLSMFANSYKKFIIKTYFETVLACVCQW